MRPPDAPIEPWSAATDLAADFTASVDSADWHVAVRCSYPPESRARHAHINEKEAGALVWSSRGLVGLLIDRSALAIVGMVGIVLAGEAYAPIDPAYPATQIDLRIRCAQLQRVVVSAPSARLGEAHPELTQLVASE